MSADLLRRAAAKIRENASAATPGPWQTAPGPWHGPDQRAIDRVNSPASERAVIPSGYALPADAVHIASWHPDVALLVADLLDDEATFAEASARDLGRPELRDAVSARSVAVARAHLGEDA